MDAESLCAELRELLAEVIGVSGALIATAAGMLIAAEVEDSLHAAAGRYDEAREALRHALADTERQLGSGHPDAVALREDLHMLTPTPTPAP